MMTAKKNGTRRLMLWPDLVEAFEYFQDQGDPFVDLSDEFIKPRYGVSDLHLALGVTRPKIRRWLIDGVIPGAKRDNRNRLYITGSTFKKLYEKYSAQVKVESRLV